MNELILRSPPTVVFGEHILQLSSQGTLHAWRTSDLEPAPDVARAFSSRPMALLAVGEGALWGCDLMSVFRWSTTTNAWEERGRVTVLAGDPVQDMVVVRHGPILIRMSHIEDVLAERVHSVPVLQGQIRTNRMRVSAVYARGDQLWVGTSYGEWGGHLIGLQLTTGQWSQFVDNLHWVTGVTGSGDGNVWVSWYMGHMSLNDTRLRLHRSDTSIVRESRAQEGHCIQDVVWDAEGKTLYVIRNGELNSLMCLEQGERGLLLKLGTLGEGEAPNAVGISPGVSDLRMLGRGRLLLVHREAPPTVYADGRLVHLRVE